MIEFCGINKSFGSHHILKNINLQVKKGEILALIGPSGAGKSTLLRLINSLEQADSGIMRVDDVELDFSKINKKELSTLRQKSAMVFQNFNLFVNKNVEQNIAEALIIVQKMPKNEALKIARKRLEAVGLAHKAKAYPYELSGGQAQRIAIARALALNTSIMLFDEPTSALDVELVGEILELIKGIENKTMLIVTHELNFAKNVADSIVFMDQGEILAHKKAKEFFTTIENERIKNFLSKISPH